MKRKSHRVAVLLAPWFLLVFQISGQSTEPTLETTMSIIAGSFNGQGTKSWKESIPNLLGASYTMTSALTEVNADSPACSLGWTSAYTSSDGDKWIESYLLKFEAVSSVDVELYSRYRNSVLKNFKLEVSPETYVVVVKTNAPLAGKREVYHDNKLKSATKLPNDREARVLFSDEQVADKVRDGILRASNLCAAKRGP